MRRAPRRRCRHGHCAYRAHRGYRPGREGASVHEGRRSSWSSSCAANGCPPSSGRITPRRRRPCSRNSPLHHAFVASVGPATLISYPRTALGPL